jgi:hypothetical protein
MKKSLLLFFIVVTTSTYSVAHDYTPWGVWFTGQTRIESRRIVSCPYGTSYAYGYSEDNLFVKPYDDYHYYNSSSFSINGNNIKVERYEKTDYGFLFTFEGEGSRKIPGTRFYDRQNIILQLQMIFEDEDICSFNIIKNTNGFQLFFFEDADVEHKVYRRYKAKEDEK